MRIFRWVLLIANVIVLGFMVTGFVMMLRLALVNRGTIVGGLMVVGLLLANIIFIVISRRNERKAIGRLTGVFE
jgi:hypothetical protein